MNELQGGYTISALQKNWTTKLLLVTAVIALSVTIVGGALIIKIKSNFWPFIPVLYLGSFLLLRYLYFNKVTLSDVTLFLNRSIPDFQESSTLLLKPADSLNLLEKLQQQKVAGAIEKVHQPEVLTKLVRFALWSVVFAIVIALVVVVIPFSNSPTAGLSAETRTYVKPEITLPQVQKVEITIAPPAYSRKPARVQNRFNIVAESGSHASWYIQTNKAVKKMELFFNNNLVVKMQSTKSTGTHWIANRKLETPGFYQLKIDSVISDLYSIEVVKDQPPVITIQSPKSSTLIEYGQPQKSLVSVSVADDYGVQSIYIAVTVASGSGEAVKFKEDRLSFSAFVPGAVRYQLRSQVDLAKIGMQPGDELYCYISATDTYNQEKLSDIFIIRLEDTARLMSIEGLVNGVDLKPEFFRSQRQIIIETEQLLKDRDTLSAEKFAAKSNELGVDQKMLRLRYGKFLGEETDTEIGEEHDHDHEEEVFGNADKLMDAYSHKHDIAEDATFFDPQTKTQLKATLNEMWKAELQLRTIKPKDALPFEYKALRLLKDLQQKSRVYVAKTGIKTTPLNPGKRLTGELEGINQPVLRHFEKLVDDVGVFRKTLGVLEQVRSGEKPDFGEKQTLQQSAAGLMQMAASEPGVYLPALRSFRNILNDTYSKNDIELVGRAFQKMIRKTTSLPVHGITSPTMSLSDRYFKNLNSKND